MEPSATVGDRGCVMTAAYQCLRCGANWQQPPSNAAICPVDGSLYTLWKNYASWRNSPSRSAEFRRLYSIVGSK
jgi:hypothetical protein